MSGEVWPVRRVVTKRSSAVAPRTSGDAKRGARSKRTRGDAFSGPARFQSERGSFGAAARGKRTKPSGVSRLDGAGEVSSGSSSSSGACSTASSSVASAAVARCRCGMPLKTYSINLEDTFLMCPDETCTLDFGESAAVAEAAETAERSVADDGAAAGSRGGNSGAGMIRLLYDNQACDVPALDAALPFGDGDDDVFSGVASGILS